MMENIKHITVSFEDIKKVSTLGDQGKKISFNIILNVNIKAVEKEKKKRLMGIHHYKNLHKAMVDELSTYISQIDINENKAHFLYLIHEYRIFLSEFISSNINVVLESYEKNNLGMNMFSFNKNVKDDYSKRFSNAKEGFQKDLNRVLFKLDNLKNDNIQYEKEIFQIQKMSKDLFEKLVDRVERSYLLYESLNKLKYDAFRVYVVFENRDFFIEFIGKQNNSYQFNWETYSEYLKMLIAQKIRNVWDIKKVA